MEMEQGLINFEEETNLKLYKLEYNGQDVYKLPTFQKWLKRANEFTDTENKKKKNMVQIFTQFAFVKNAMDILFVILHLSIVM